MAVHSLWCDFSFCLAFVLFCDDSNSRTTVFLLQTQSNALDVLIAADMMGIEMLKTLAGSVLLRTVTIHNVVQIYALAEQFNGLV